MTNSPCYKCPDRVTTAEHNCHNECVKYAEYLAIHAEEIQQMREKTAKERMLLSYRIEKRERLLALKRERR